MAIFPWYGGLAKGWQYGAAKFLSVQDYKNVQRWADMLLERPAVRRGYGQSPLGRAIEPVARAA
jgi:GST-like protein